MVLFLLAYLGGVLTIISPCILPVLPFVFAGADRPFVRSGLPMLAGMAVTFAAVTTLAAVAGGWPWRRTSSAALSPWPCLPCSGWRYCFPTSPPTPPQRLLR
jgi:hypothetical protein